MGRNTMIERPPESWSNPMTRCVYTWLGQDEEYWSEVAAEICDSCFRSENAWLKAIDKLASRIKNSFEAYYPPKQSLPDAYYDLLDTALDMIKYREIARAFLNDLDVINDFKVKHGMP